MISMTAPSVSAPRHTGTSSGAAGQVGRGAPVGSNGGGLSVSNDDEVITGEAVAIAVRPASFILRTAGAIIDWICYAIVFALLVLAIVSMATQGLIDFALLRALIIAALVFSFVIIPVSIETLTHGRSIGKFAIGARIVRDDGGAITFRHAVVRGLMAVPEILMTGGGLAIIVSLLNSKSKRLGDLLAGTYSQHERVPAILDTARPIPPRLLGWAEIADVGKLPDPLARRIARFLSQAPKMSAHARGRIAAELANEATPYVSPVPRVAPEEFLAGVAGVRRDREYTALMAERARLDRLSPILTGLPNSFPDR